MRYKTSFLADFHVHSTFSDGSLCLPKVIDLYGQRGFGAIAITDHIGEENTLIGKAAIQLGKVLTRATFPLYKALLESEAKRAWEQYEMIVLTGFELSKNSINNYRSAHILGVGIHSYLPADADALDLIKAIHSQGGLAIAAHPVNTRRFEKQTYYLWDRRRELSEHFDAWEVASGPHIFDEVAAEKFPLIANSDLHMEKQLRSWKTVLHCEKHPEAILQAIKKRELDFHFYEEEVRWAS